MLFVYGGIPGLPVHHRRTRVDQVPDLRGRRLLEKEEVAPQVRFEHFQGDLGKGPGHVDDGVHSLDRGLHGLPVFQARLDQGQSIADDRPDGPDVLVDDPDRMPAFQQPRRQVPSARSRPAGDQDFRFLRHVRVPSKKVKRPGKSMDRDSPDRFPEAKRRTLSVTNGSPVPSAAFPPISDNTLPPSPGADAGLLLPLGQEIRNGRPEEDDDGRHHERKSDRGREQDERAAARDE